MRRVACVALPEIRVELAGEGQGRAPGPFAVVIARPGSPLRTERDVLGGTRLDVVSREARAEGVRAGQTVAAARARCAGLGVRVVAEGAVRAALARLAEAGLALGPVSGFDVAQDVVWIDVTGCAHLHGGEAALARALEGRVRALGHAGRIAVADGPRIAAAVARFAQGEPGSGPLVVPPGKGAAAMRGLPVEALALGADVTAWLRDLGLARCGDLQKLPRRSLGTRLGARAHDVMLLLDGEDRAPLEAWRPPEAPEERVELEWGAASTEALAFVVKTLCDRLAARLSGRAMAAARLDLVLALDRALCAGQPHLSMLEIVLPVPLARAGELLAVVRARLERHVLVAPALAVTLRASELSRVVTRTLDLLEPEPVAAHALPRLVAELSAELGAARVGVLALVDTWVPEERTRLAAFGAPAGDGPRRARAPLVGSALEPSRLVAPRPVERGQLDVVRPLARVEAVEWWRRPAVRSDLCAAWVRAGHEGALGWIALRGDEAILLGWVD